MRPARQATAALVPPFANAEAMSLHLAEIAKEVAPGAHAVLVLDGAGTHAATALKAPSDISLLKLPPYAPEPDPVENIRAYLRGNGLSDTVFESYEDIAGKSCDAWMFFASDPDRIASVTTRDRAAVDV